LRREAGAGAEGKGRRDRDEVGVFIPNIIATDFIFTSKFIKKI
jgi:hypothetical protein